ncbi:hypothetical protein HK102_001403 [Quaeritorhiza haematococci]|nr:hypothetical protein HK102_001403 [Quaeritorhiza haematococci]
MIRLSTILAGTCTIFLTTATQVTAQTVGSLLTQIKAIDTQTEVLNFANAWDLSNDRILSVAELQQMEQANPLLGLPENARADHQISGVSDAIQRLLNSPAQGCQDCTADFQLENFPPQSCSAKGTDPQSRLRANLQCAMGISEPRPNPDGTTTAVAKRSINDPAVEKRQILLVALAVYVVATTAYIYFNLPQNPPRPVPVVDIGRPDCDFGTFELDRVCFAIRSATGSDRTEFCPRPPVSGGFIARSLHLSKRQADFPLSRFNFVDSSCTADNKNKIVTAFSEARTIIQDMKKDLDETLKNAAANGNVIPLRSNMGIAFGQVPCNVLKQCDYIATCVNKMLATVTSGQIVIPQCDLVDGKQNSAIAGAKPDHSPPEVSLGREFFRCSPTAGLDNWSVVLPSTTIIHELSHALCPTSDQLFLENAILTKTINEIYYPGRDEYQQILRDIERVSRLPEKEGRFKFGTRLFADAWRIWATAVKANGVFPKFGNDPAK